MNNFDYKNMTPFKWFVLENFPFIENDFEAINNYRLFSKVVEYLNKVIDDMNAVGQQTENITNAMTELQNYVNNYFDNLDVQEEINNKLDEMVEQGTLQEIIADYLNSKAVFGFDTVNDMKQATNLIDGSYARTLGENNFNDGKGALYKIREIINTDVVDNINIIPLNNNNLIAERINENIYLYSIDYLDENSDDNSTAFNTMVNTAIAQNKSIIIKNGTYKFTKPLTMYTGTEIIGEGNVIFDFTNFNDNSEYCISIEQGSISLLVARGKTIFKNIIFKGYNSIVKLHPDLNEYSTKNLFFIQTHEFNFENIYCYGFNKVFTYGNNAYIINVINSTFAYNNYAIYFDNTGYTNLGERLAFVNCVICNNRIAMHVKIGMFNFTDCSIDYNLQICDYFQSKISGTSSGRTTFLNCHLEDSASDLINRFITDNAVIMFSNCTFWFKTLPYFIDNSGGVGNRLYFVNCEYRCSANVNDGSYNTPFVKTNKKGVSSINKVYGTVYNTFLKMTKFNKYITNNYAKFIANVTNGTAELDNDGSLKTSSNNYVTAETNTDFIEIPQGYTDIWLSMLIKGNSENSSNKRVFIFYDDNQNQLNSISTTWTTTSDYVYKTAVAEIPDNAKYVKVYLETPLSTNGITNYKDIFIDFS